MKIENNNKIKMCSFLVVPGNREPLLGMPDIKALGILTVNCNTIEVKKDDGLEKSRTNTKQEIDATEKHYANTDGSNWNLR